MTVVVGIRTTGGVLLAGDSQGSTLWSNRKSLDSKTIQLSELLAVAYCGSGRLGNLLTHHLDELDDPPLGRDAHRWAVRDFIPYLRQVAFDHGALRHRNGIERLDESAFLFAVRGHLFTVEDDLQVYEHVLPYNALGSGDDVAIGSLRSEFGEGRDPLDGVTDEGIARVEQAAEDAVLASTEFTNFVGGDITYLWTIPYTEEELEFARTITAAT